MYATAILAQTLEVFSCPIELFALVPYCLGGPPRIVPGVEEQCLMSP
jgi:hypothetical protein